MFLTRSSASVFIALIKYFPELKVEHVIARGTNEALKSDGSTFYKVRALDFKWKITETAFRIAKKGANEGILSNCNR